MPHPLSTSGVVGLGGRFPLPAADATPASALVLAGAPLPLVGRLRVYTCGITPYDVTHLGHAAVFVWTDLLRSVARTADVDTVMCRNVTDVDDVLTAAASGRGRHYDEFALTQEFSFEQDMKALGVATPDARPHARTHVRQVVDLASALLRQDRAYVSDGSVFFRGAHLPGTAGLDRDAALALSREFGDQPAEPDGRADPLDVPVWRPSLEDDPAWPSPWGWGRPGWHAECAAMAATVFGASADVLVGGADLTFPHHAYQAAMLEDATGVRPFARRAVHVGTVRHAGAKMAKSTGNLVLVRDLLSAVPGPVVRLMLLHRRWHESWEYDAAELDDAGALLDRLYAAAARPASREAAVAAVTEALLHDLDVPGAAAVAQEAGGEAARFLVDVLKLSATPGDR